ncbi:HlyD family secretion protein [Salinicola aestuarinus]|uniref:HlyD family secretion protein n=1 Tax=Salinicola aestuarinus TaxID=1949082 RepID=UPI000DA1BCEC|nr:HlyD family secretion protein [Salinicola aestuarinus]
MTQSADNAQPRRRKPLILALCIVVIAVVAAAVLAGQTLTPDDDAWTNDAHLDADYVVISPRVNGNLVAVHVDDHDRVARGDALLEIDPRDYRAAVDEAEAQVAAARANLAEVEAELAQQPAKIRNAEATVSQDNANADYARADAERYRRLRNNNNVSAQDAQKADANARALDARREADQANLESVRQQRKILEAQKESAEAALASARAQQEKARLSLSYTQIDAPVDGVVAEQSARVGAWVDAGSAQLAIVPVHGIYITAHYREVDITHIEPGQPVDITVDAYPDLDLHGHVKSLSPATGVTFSPVSSNETSGNFTKILQRLPVRIALDPDQPGLDRLRVGLSVETTIHTNAPD